MARSVTLKGNPVALDGPEIKVGDKAPSATLKKSLAEAIDLADTTGKVRILSVVPSLDTPVCAIQTKRFNEEAAGLDGVDIYTISTDLPVAMSRFCGAESIDTQRMHMLSDHMDGAFGKAYGTLIPNIRIECRALFVLDKDDTVKHVEYVSEVANEPNYDAAISVVKSLL
jgi:thiol peroxidase